MQEENKKYELVADEYIEVEAEEGSKKLYRIRALKNFEGMRPGYLGGYIESESNLSHEGNCWVYGDARVTGDALVTGEAQVADKAQVGGEALVGGKARIDGKARIGGEAQVFGEAWVDGEARVDGRARIGDRARVAEDAQVSKRPIFISGLYYNITITDTHIQVGCQCKTLEEWKSMTLEDLETNFGYEAVKFHDKYWKVIEHLAIGHQRQQ